MTNDSDTIFERIRKCLALSKCSDEHEAAAALLAAQRLMVKHNISITDVRLLDIGESNTAASVKKRPTAWEASLADVVGDAFGCKVVFLGGRGEWSFIGTRPNFKIASYVFAVLLRQLRYARKEHIRKLGRKYKKKRKVICGDLYCSAWVFSISEKVQVFAGNIVDREYFEKYISQKYPTTKELSPNDRIGDGDKIDGLGWLSYSKGRNDGMSVSLQNGISGDELKQRYIGCGEGV